MIINNFMIFNKTLKKIMALKKRNMRKKLNNFNINKHSESIA